jgi:3'-phosphoadenosine 5'-phosphosulfate sulfotransferase (PAPS reductase)/FAD synthetase
VREHDLERHPLYDRGYRSIGCAPCTRAVGPDEDERAGRWWWEESTIKECGLHWSGDRLVRRGGTR